MAAISRRLSVATKAKAFVMPGKTDLYFPPEDSEFVSSKWLIC